MLVGQVARQRLFSLLQELLAQLGDKEKTRAQERIGGISPDGRPWACVPPPSIPLASPLSPLGSI